MADQSELLAELFGSIAVRAANVREVAVPSGEALNLPQNGALDEYAHPHLTARQGHFHWLIDGEAMMQGKTATEGAALAAGSVLLFPQGGFHGDGPDVPNASIVCSSGCRWISGNFSSGNPATARLIHGLPPVLRSGAETGATIMRGLLPLLAEELSTNASGGLAIINGVIHILFIQTLRGFIGGFSHNAAGWFRASLDPDIGPVLLLLHSRPEEPWTVATMAEQALMSRSSFAAKFNELVGEPPLQYLTKYRMDKARMMLRDETQPVKEIARTVGYISEAAFSTAFRRTEGIAPGSIRKEAKSSAVAAKSNAAPAA